MSNDNTQEPATPSPASAGSHGKVTLSLHTDDSACAFPDSRPIRRQRFTLTDEEREAIRKALIVMRIHEDDDEDVLEALLERTK